MITDVPTHADLIETADGWLNLAWEQVIETASDHAETVNYIDAGEIKPSPGVFEKLWNARRHKLNNALLLCQQAMELYLKARIAIVSPYLLIVGEPRSWPNPSSSGAVSFLDFKTLDASQLCRSARIVSDETLTSEYQAYFETLRKMRNKIAHLHAGNFPSETTARICDCLEVFRLNHPQDRWQRFRKAYIMKSGRHGPLGEYDYDYTHTSFLFELSAAVDVLDNASSKKYFGLDKKKKRMLCPNCEEMRQKHDTDERSFAQARADGTISCAGCLKEYDRASYQKLAADYDD